MKFGKTLIENIEEDYEKYPFCNCKINISNNKMNNDEILSRIRKHYLFWIH